MGAFPSIVLGLACCYGKVLITTDINLILSRRKFSKTAKKIPLENTKITNSEVVTTFSNDGYSGNNNGQRGVTVTNTTYITQFFSFTSIDGTVKKGEITFVKGSCSGPGPYQLVYNPDDESQIMTLSNVGGVGGGILYGLLFYFAAVLPFVFSYPDFGIEAMKHIFDPYGCTNVEKYSDNCYSWYNEGECESNEEWMRYNCAFQCSNCVDGVLKPEYDDATWYTPLGIMFIGFCWYIPIGLVLFCLGSTPYQIIKFSDLSLNDEEATKEDNAENKIKRSYDDAGNYVLVKPDYLHVNEISGTETKKQQQETLRFEYEKKLADLESV